MRIFVPLLLSMCLVLSACGSGSGDDGGGGGSTLSGWYDVELSTLPPTYKTVWTGEVEESGNSLFYEGREHVREGDEWVHYIPASYAPDRAELALWVVSEGELEGANRYISANVQTGSHLLRLHRSVVPAGVMSTAGTLLGSDITVDDVPAHGRDAGSPGSYTFLLESVRARALEVVQFSFTQDPPLATGTYVHGSSTWNHASVRAEHGSDLVISGTLILTNWTSTQVAGSYSLWMQNGGQVAGVFEVPITLHE